MINYFPKIAWLGGDKRQSYARNALKTLGIDSSLYLLEEGDSALLKTMIDRHLVWILPLPMSRDGIWLNSKSPFSLADFAASISPNAFVLGGKMPTRFCSILEERHIRYADYYTDEFQIANALPTAEGAIAMALYEMPIVLSDSNVLVVGYGRIGKLLTAKLQLLGANVTVLARKESDLAFAKAYGHLSMSIQNGIHDAIPLSHYDVIFNTVPSLLFDRSIIERMNKDTLYIELASLPGGIDIESAKHYGMKVISAQSLPGKFSPITAGRILAESVVQILQREDIDIL